MNYPRFSKYLHVLLLLVLAACQAPPTFTAVPISPSQTPLPTSTPVVPTATMVPGDAKARAEVAGGYSYKVVGLPFTIYFHLDGTYASLPSTGAYLVTADEITFVDTLRESGSLCGSEPGVYQWELKDNILTLIPVSDNCASRANIFGTNTFEKMQDQTNEPVEFVWRITGAPNPFIRPTDIAVDEQSNIYVVDGGNHRIQKFDTNGKLLKMWGEYGDGDGQFIFRVEPDHFGAVAIDGAGNMYVTDYNSRVQKFDSNGTFLLKWGRPGNGDGQFALHSHLSVAVDTQGNVYVTDTDNSRVQKFDSNGTFLLKWGSKGSGDGQFGEDHNWRGPEGVAVDSQGNVYVADPANQRIEKFDSNGNFLSQLGGKGTEDGQFLNPGDVTVDQQGNIYVTDNQQNVGGPTSRFSKFDSNGTFLLKWGETGTGLGMLNYPAGIAVDQQGNIYVVNVIENVQKFRPK